MENICKYNKYGHCRFGKFCNFYHEDRKCETEGCDHKICCYRHPQPCRYIKTRKSCKFGDSCDFDHDGDVIDIEINTLKVRADDLKIL